MNTVGVDQEHQSQRICMDGGSTTRSAPTQDSASPIQQAQAPSSLEEVSDLAATATDNNRQGTVRAMAAKFEKERQRNMPRVTPKPTDRSQSLAFHNSSTSPGRFVRPTRSVSTPGRQSFRNVSSTSRDLSSRNTSRSTVADGMFDRELRMSIGEDAALRALELRQARRYRSAKGNTDVQDGLEGKVSRGTIPTRRSVLKPQEVDISAQNPPNLGTMIPYPKQPPVAQHLNLPRPPSSSSNSQQETQASLDMLQTGLTPAARPGSATMLHAQIRVLQRQLYLKTEEAMQLRRQLEAHANSELGTLSQKLREARQEAEAWKERAEAAERRIHVFERFTARLKGIREATDVTDGQGSIQATITPSILDKGHELESLALPPHSILATRGYESDGSGRTEDAGTVTARIRKCLHGSARTDGAGDDLNMFHDLRGVTYFTVDAEDMRRDAINKRQTISPWMAAEELRDHERQ